MSTTEGNNVVEVRRGRIAVASMAGTTIEFYDFYVYATAAVSVFPHLFFPRSSPTTALLASLGTFGLAFVARPVGSILFGHFGDRVGRKATLVVSLLTMGIATFLIGLLPTYDQVGLIAPALLAVMRFCQGLALGGEWSRGRPAGHRDSAPRSAGLVRDVAADGGAIGVSAGQRRLSGADHLARQRLAAACAEPLLLQLGLAHSVFAEFGNGGDRTVCASAAGRDSGVYPIHRAWRTR